MEDKKEGCNGCGQSLEVVENMNVNHSQHPKAPCSGCSGNKLSSKLGTCKACIVSNIFGAALCWISFCVFYFLYPVKNAMYCSLIFASFFSLLLSAHGVAYLIKKNKKL